MQQSFQPKHIKRYVLLYLGVIAIVILFYIINMFINPEPTRHERKVFNTTPAQTESALQPEAAQEKEASSIKLLPKAY